jgi:hypothetical protein
VTLGLEARDSCWFAPVALQQSIELVRDAITPVIAKPPLPPEGLQDSCLVDVPLVSFDESAGMDHRLKGFTAFLNLPFEILWSCEAFAGAAN